MAHESIRAVLGLKPGQRARSQAPAIIRNYIYEVCMAEMADAEAWWEASTPQERFGASGSRYPSAPEGHPREAMAWGDLTSIERHAVTRNLLNGGAIAGNLEYEARLGRTE